MSTVPVDDLGEEREVDLRSLRDRMLGRWWLVLGGLVIGAVVGLLVGTGGGTVYDAKALLYLGQPFASGQQVNSLSTNPRTVFEIVRSESVVKAIADETGIPVKKLRRSVTTAALTGIGTNAGLGRNTPLIELTVQLRDPAEAETAANAFAKAIVDTVGTYVAKKIAILEKRQAQDREILAAAQARVRDALAQQKVASDATGLSLADRLIIQANVNGTLQFYEARINNMRTDLNEADQSLSVARDIEQSRVVEPAVAAPTKARSQRNSLVVGALIGLILGGLAAAFLPPLRGRKQATRT